MGVIIQAIDLKSLHKFNIIITKQIDITSMDSQLKRKSRCRGIISTLSE